MSALGQRCLWKYSISHELTPILCSTKPPPTHPPTYLTSLPPCPPPTLPPTQSHHPPAPRPPSHPPNLTTPLPPGRTHLRRKGVGWLVAQCETPPLVVPFVHSGMERVIPKGAKLPQLGERVHSVRFACVLGGCFARRLGSRSWASDPVQAACSVFLCFAEPLAAAAAAA